MQIKFGCCFGNFALKLVDIANKQNRDVGQHFVKWFCRVRPRKRRQCVT